MKRVSISRMADAPKAKFIGMYLMTCHSCPDKTVNWNKPQEIFVDAKKLSWHRAKHEDHNWVIRSESILSKSKLKEMLRLVRRK